MKIVKLLLITAFVAVACGRTPMQEAGDLVTKYTGKLQSVNASMMKAGNADQAVAAMEEYTSTMLMLAKDMKALEMKHPNLKLKDENDPEIKKMTEPMIKEIEAWTGNMMKIGMKYASDAKFLAAMEKFQKEMQSVSE